MGQFLLCVLQYVIEMIVILGIGLCGAFLGIKLRKGKNAKNTADAEKE